MFLSAAALALAGGGLGAGACAVEDSEAATTTRIRGLVVDAAGTPLADVRIEGTTGGAVSDGAGTFEIDAPHGEPAVLTFHSKGYVRGLERFDVGDASELRVDIAMVRMAEPIPLDSTVGGEVVGVRQAALVAGPEVFRDQSGNPVTGMVDVHLTPLNPSIAAELDAYPGDGLARDAAGQTIHLETFGVLDVTVMQGDEELNIREGMGVTIRIPLPDPLPMDPPASIALWGFDDDAGVWVEEGIATLDADQGVYEGTIGHLSPWNADQPLDATCIKGRALHSSGDPAANVLVVARGVDYIGSSMTVTEDDGHFCAAVRKDSEVRVSLIGPTNMRGSKIVHSGSAETAIPPVCTEPSCLAVGDISLTAPDPGGGGGGGGGGGEGTGGSGGGGAFPECMWGDAPYLEMELSGDVDGTQRWDEDPGDGPCLGLPENFSLEDATAVVFPVPPGESGWFARIQMEVFPGEVVDGVTAAVELRPSNGAFNQGYADDGCTVDITRNERIGPDSHQLEGRGRCPNPLRQFDGTGGEITIVGEFEFSAVRVGLDQYDEAFIACCIDKRIAETLAP